MSDKQSIPTSNAAALEAMIQYNSSGFHRHILREIRRDGAFVEMVNVRVLQYEAPIKIVFVHHDKGISYTHLIEARVREISGHGAHLEFANLDHQAHEALRTLEQRQ
ncbi:MAG: hypothetical protein LJE56_06085 [Acidiferrobacterales bacterium]|jgi:hypothetical protein|nr:hypothetical protein [Acidiferrobacterales bacterium]